MLNLSVGLSALILAGFSIAVTIVLYTSRCHQFVPQKRRYVIAGLVIVINIYSASSFESK